MTENLQVKNIDIASLARRINRILVELLKANSADYSGVNEHDLRRIKSYIASIKGYVEWAAGHPLLDLTETHPTLIELVPGPEIVQVENDEINDMVTMLRIARDEITNSECARKANGIEDIAKAKFMAVIDKVELFVNEFIPDITPLDWSKSSPRDERAGSGARGI